MQNNKIQFGVAASFEHRRMIIAGALALAMVAMAIVGAVRAYTPVPYSDMWVGYLGFIQNIQSGDTAAWWREHNEHRIVFARLFFWMDHKWFGTEAWFLIVVNYVLVVSACLLFWRIALDSISPKRAAVYFGLALTGWLFLWCQEENFTWGFQSQFFLAQLLPLCAFYLLHRSTLSDGIPAFLAALGFGIASIGTMANGILCLPLMLLFSLLTRQKPVRSLALLAASTATLFAYFHGYRSPGHLGVLLATLRTDPLGLLQFVFVYLGSPFYHVFGQGNRGWFAANTAGLLFVIAAMYFALDLLRRPKNTLRSALTLYILYVGATALGTAGGRLVIGIAQVLSPRYTTPAIMAWSALLILCAPTLVSFANHHKKKSVLAFAMLAFLVVSVQIKALDSREDELFERKLAGLALALGAKDRSQINRALGPPVEYAMPEVEKAVAQKLSIFGTFPLRGVRKGLGTEFRRTGLPACQAALDGVATIEREPKFLRIQGWIFDPNRRAAPGAVRLLDEQGKMIGFAIAGQSRPDVAKAIHKQAGRAGFQGFLRADQLGSVLTLSAENSDGPACQVQATAPVSFFSYQQRTPTPGQATIGTANILPGNQWLGSDYSRAVVGGMRIHGSFVRSDADIGAITLRLKRGDRLFYRSGPTAGRQLLEFPGTPLPAMKLPLAPEWILLDFSGPSLPEGEFVAKLSDNGNAWGEWSAIAVKEN